jgi:hypothetical protein
MSGSDDIVAILILLWRCPMPVPRRRAFRTAVRLEQASAIPGLPDSHSFFCLLLQNVWIRFLVRFGFHHIFFNAWRIEIVIFHLPSSVFLTMQVWFLTFSGENTSSSVR